MKPTLCVIDTGVNPHIDLVMPRCRIIEFIDTIHGKKLPYDDNGHGTFVTGVAMGNGMLSGGKIRGLGHNHDFISIKAIDHTGRATISEIVRAINMALKLKDKYNIRVLVMSFSINNYTYNTKSLEEAIHRLNNQGIIVVSAVGNNGYGIIGGPLITPNVISVGAVDNNLDICHFTSRGIVDGVVKPDFYSLGKDVVGLGNIGYITMSGTSVAAPYVASIILMILDNMPHASLDDVKRILRSLSVEKDNMYIL